MAKLPDFDKMWAAYPGKEEADEVKQMIGGAVNASWITNTCAIRMSRALNYADPKKAFAIPFGYKFSTAGNPTVLNTVKGKDGMRYAFRVAELLKYMKERFGKPTIRKFKARDEGMPPEFEGRKGIVVFNDCGWTDATGHFDLWNGSEIGHEAYWEKAKEVYLWALDGKYTVVGSSTVRQGDTPIVTVSRR